MTRLLFLLFLSGLAGAQEVSCRYDGSQLEMNACAIRDFNAADTVLNKTYSEVVGKLLASDQKTLRTEQDAWAKRRGARCASSKQNPGSNSTIDYYTCMEMLTEIRILQLKSFTPK
ncbi:lysozyme inhibitor LprI family protein [Acinetobacter sp.]|uniref:lysozyme inhibitor LprI family protein n=1 Tax=Acinetobacter sp. TaxID=472 RepID=UPI00388F77DC